MAVTVRDGVREDEEEVVVVVVVVEARLGRVTDDERERAIGRLDCGDSSTCVGFCFSPSMPTGLLFGKVLFRLVLVVAAVTVELRFRPVPVFVIVVGCVGLTTVIAAAGVFSFLS